MLSSHVAKLMEIAGKTQVLYSEFGEITGKTRVLPNGLAYVSREKRILFYNMFNPQTEIRGQFDPEGLICAVVP